jgi:SAM-dependent methyltransferase
MNIQNKKLEKLLSCPNCKLPTLKMGLQKIKCEACGESFNICLNTPVLIKKDSPVLEWYEPKKISTLSTSKGFKKVVHALYIWLKPEDRVWTTNSLKAIHGLLEENNPDADDCNVVLVGAGFERVYRRILKLYRNIIRIGLPSRGDVDLVSDICDIPLIKDSLDLLLSSSVLEHVYNPEQAVKEMFRVVKPGGYVYAEIPFMRAYHMIPVDYQRYTISGIEELFKRHGFTLISKGICSGPFTALALFLTDFGGSLFSFNKYIRAIFSLILSLIFHPVKYLDRFFENSQWAKVNACNFYYIGRKNEISPSFEFETEPVNQAHPRHCRGNSTLRRKRCSVARASCFGL